VLSLGSILKFLYLLLRIIFGLLFLASAIGKLLDNRGFADVIVTYQLIPQSLTLGLGLFVSLFELALGLAIVFERKVLLCAYFTIAVHIGYLSLAALTMARGINLSNCGCFGVFLARPLGLQTLVEDAILLILSILFLFTVRQNKELL
jgi:uncharacterized membrane protein YphA (DoxX/SURF4 family)